MFIHVHYPLNQSANFIHSVLKGILPISRHAHTLLIFLCYVCTRKLIVNHLHYRKGNVTFHNNFIKSTFPHKYVAVTYCAWRYSLLLSSILSLRIATSADRRLSRWLSSFWTSERVCASAWVFWYLKQKVINEESKGIKHYGKDYCAITGGFVACLQVLIFAVVGQTSYKHSWNISSVHCFVILTITRI